MLRRPADALQYELLEEGASTLGRVGVELERALEVLRAFDAALAATRAHAPDARAELVAEAGDRLWTYVVQREAMGLRNHDTAMKMFRVPRDVYARMGPKRRKPR